MPCGRSLNPKQRKIIWTILSCNVRDIINSFDDDLVPHPALCMHVAIKTSARVDAGSILQDPISSDAFVQYCVVRFPDSCANGKQENRASDGSG